MFWGMNLKPNRKYSQTTAKSFHISQAALDPEGADDTVNKIYISGEDNQKFLICTLRKNICEQVQLDLNFAEGDPICFQTIGSGNVCLSGYLVEQSFFGGGPEDEEEESEDESMAEKVAALLNGGGETGKKKKNNKKAKAGKGDEDSDEEDEDDEDDALNAALESDDDDDEEDAEMEDGNDDDDSEDDDEEEEDDDDEDDDDEDDEEELQEPKKKMAKIEKDSNKQQQKQNGEQKSKKENKSEKQQQQQQQQKQQPQQKQQQQQQKAGEERTLTGGVKVVDVRVGNGEEAKHGKRAHVYYEGRLKSNNKVFDSLKNGAPFKFKIGGGEVIKSWDIGVAGMKVGGKRRIICPPHMAYGSRGSPPTIPPNSTLVFEVELKSVSK